MTRDSSTAIINRKNLNSFIREDRGYREQGPNLKKLSCHEFNLIDPSKSDQILIPAEFADSNCSLCDHIIQKVNEIFEQDDTLCPDTKEYCITHLLEVMHTSLIWRLSKL